MLLEITVPVGVLGLVDGHSLPAGTTLEFERTASVSDNGSLALVVVGDDSTTVVEYLRDGSAIETVAVRTLTENGAIVQPRWNGTIPDFIGGIRENNGTVLSAFARDDVWTFDIRFPSKDAAARFYTDYDDDSYPISVRRMDNADTSLYLSNGHLTDDQREVLCRAMEAGYFEVPRRTTLVDLAHELECADVTVSERLRQGVANLIRNSKLVSKETVESIRHDN